MISSNENRILAPIVLFAYDRADHLAKVLNSIKKAELSEETSIYIFCDGPKNEKDKLNPKWGTIRSLVSNIVTGVSKGFSKTLELNGTGYRASVSGTTLKLQLGFSHDIDHAIPKEVKIECPKQNIIKLSSFNKEILGATAAKIRSYRKPEPFKGKGIKYDDELYLEKKVRKNKG